MRFTTLVPFLLWSGALAAPSPAAEAKARDLEAMADSIDGILAGRQVSTSPARIETVVGNVFAARDVCQGRMNTILNDLNGISLPGDAGASLYQRINRFTAQWAELRTTLSSTANGLRSVANGIRNGENVAVRPW